MGMCCVRTTLREWRMLDTRFYVRRRACIRPLLNLHFNPLFFAILSLFIIISNPKVCNILTWTLFLKKFIDFFILTPQ